MTDAPVSAHDLLTAAFRSDPGRVRANNEDVALVDSARGVYGVIDGMGGQAAGEVAAGIARDVILQRLARPLGSPAERVREAIAIANNEIFGRAERTPELHGMACVVTLAIVSSGTLTIGHVGDSRLYTFGPGGLRKLTHDHSPIGEREDAQELSETEAMRHPRRNQVFRDVGSARRDKDEEEFVEVIEAPLPPDSAILLCSDGLTDMVSSAAIERLVRAHAGRPQDVADALVAAANEAGGKDNVTVVYAERHGFAAALGGEPGQPPSAPDGRPAPRRRPLAALGGRVVRSRTTWFTAGTLAGVLAALILVWRVGLTGFDGSRTLVVGPEAPASFTRIGQAMAGARPGDVVRLEPGVYPERVILRDGVDLVARIPGTVAIVRPSNASGEVVGLTVFGSACGRVSGVSVQSTPALPIDVGVRIHGQGCTLEQLDLSGGMQAGVEVMPAATVVVRGTLFSVQGVAVAFGDEAQATLASNVLMRIGRPVEAFALAPTSQVTIQRNLFAGFGTEIVRGMSAPLRQQLLAGNFVVAAEPALQR
jgi:serine/threonine protein phosphatase PrpC